MPKRQLILRSTLLFAAAALEACTKDASHTALGPVSNPVTITLTDSVTALRRTR